MKRWTFFIYGVACHLAFLVIYAWLAAFVGNFLVPKTIDAPATTRPTTAVLVDLGLVLAFGLQHSIMARPAFKRVWTRVVPEPIERSTYVLASNVITVLLMLLWQPIDAVVWQADSGPLRWIVWSVFVCGWLTVPAVTLIIDHFDLFGTRQVWFYLRGKPYEPLPFSVRLLYRYVRHPLYIGWALAFWAIPTMTVGHFLFAAAMTGYMALATLFEERDLLMYFGRRYAEYRRNVPRFVPRLRRVPAPAGFGGPVDRNPRPLPGFNPATAEEDAHVLLPCGDPHDEAAKRATGPGSDRRAGRDGPSRELAAVSRALRRRTDLQR
jgi:protein-S-isoprenylcysteine O-methyltransferase Ste14